MELKEAIELLKTVRGNEYVATADYENALNTVLNELKQTKADLYSANCIIDDLISEMSAEEFLSIIGAECDKYDGCSDECKFKRRGHCATLTPIALTIAKKLKEVE